MSGRRSRRTCAPANSLHNFFWRLRDSDADSLVIGWVTGRLPDLASVVFGLSLVFAIGEQSELNEAISVSVTATSDITKLWESLVARIVFVLISWHIFYRALAIIRRSSSLFLITMMVALLFNLLAEICYFANPVIPFLLPPVRESAYLAEFTSFFLSAYFFVVFLGCLQQANGPRSYAVGFAFYVLGLTLLMLFAGVVGMTSILAWIWPGIAFFVAAFIVGRIHAAIYRTAQDREIRALIAVARTRA